ncbi:MAG TPA: hypothetical protein VGA39_05585 [Candidatus Acidoferrales bacterium]
MNTEHGSRELEAGGRKLAAGSSRLYTWWQGVREFLFGMVGLEMVRHAVEMRASLENVFILATFGDLIGVPILPPYYSLRLLPYVVPQIATWKRRVLREREFTDEHDYHLHGL